jgi:hypothetical protein
MRWVTDDRVMKATEGLMDARHRVKAAWDLLLNGHALPNIDPALDESLGRTEGKAEAKNGRSNGHKNGQHAAVVIGGDGELGHPSTNGSNGKNGNFASRPLHGSEDMDESMKERSSSRATLDRARRSGRRDAGRAQLPLC